MNAKQFRCAVHLLFGGAKKMSASTGINLRSIRRWSSGETRVPDTVRALLRAGLFKRLATEWELLGDTDPAIGSCYTCCLPIDVLQDSEDLARAVARRALERAKASFIGLERRYDAGTCTWHWLAWGYAVAEMARE